MTARYRRELTGNKRKAVLRRDVTEFDIILMKGFVVDMRRGKYFGSEAEARAAARFLRSMKLWFQVARPRSAVTQELADLRWKVVGKCLHSRPKNGYYLLEEFCD